MKRIGAGLLALFCLLVAPAALTAAPQMEEILATALRHEHGEGTPRDLPQAIAAYCQAVEMGSADAAFQLGWMYYVARGVVGDDETAARWFTLAAARGHRQAATLLERLPPLTRTTPPTDCAPPPPSPPPALPPSPARLEAPAEIRRLVDTMAARYKIDPKLVLAVIKVESNFQQNAVSPKGALGLMQLMPDTAAQFGVAHVLEPKENIAGGIKYLHHLLCNFNGNIPFALASYNAGEGAILKYGGIPPYNETLKYLKLLKMIYSSDRHTPLNCP